MIVQSTNAAKGNLKRKNRKVKRILQYFEILPFCLPQQLVNLLHLVNFNQGFSSINSSIITEIILNLYPYLLIIII